MQQVLWEQLNSSVWNGIGGQQLTVLPDVDKTTLYIPLPVQSGQSPCSRELINTQRICRWVKEPLVSPF